MSVRNKNYKYLHIGLVQVLIVNEFSTVKFSELLTDIMKLDYMIPKNHFYIFFIKVVLCITELKGKIIKD